MSMFPGQAGTGMDLPGFLSVGGGCLEATAPAEPQVVPVPSLAHQAGPLGALGHAGTWVWLLLDVRALGRETGVKQLWQHGHGQGHQGHLNTSQGKAPSPQGPSYSVPEASELELQSPSSLQPLPGKGVLEPELGFVCRSLALIPSSSSSLLSLLAGFVELDLPAKESPCRPCRADDF